MNSQVPIEFMTFELDVVQSHSATEVQEKYFTDRDDAANGNFYFIIVIQYWWRMSYAMFWLCNIHI